MPPSGKVRTLLRENGYAVIPNVLPPALVSRLREALLSSVQARERYFLQFPLLETMLKSDSRMADPVYNKAVRHIKQRSATLRRRRAERKRKLQLLRASKQLGIELREGMTGEELYALGVKVAESLDKVNLSRCTSTVDNDQQMLRAINEYRANAWMTNAALREALHDPGVNAPLGDIASSIVGVEEPVLFGDTPYVRAPFGSPFFYHCAAPTIGVKTNQTATPGPAAAPAAAMLLYTHDMSCDAMPLQTLRSSHRYVREQYINVVRPEALDARLLLLETHIPAQLQHFQFGDEVAGSAVPEDIRAGSVVVVDPHLMYAFGPNRTPSTLGVLRLNFVGRKEKAFMAAPSWIKGWRSRPNEVDFGSPVVFPPFFTHPGQ